MFRPCGKFSNAKAAGRGTTRVRKKIPEQLADHEGYRENGGVVEPWGFEPQTFSLRTRRSTN